jgi:hypothetical protein
MGGRVGEEAVDGGLQVGNGSEHIILEAHLVSLAKKNAASAPR